MVLGVSGGGESSKQTCGSSLRCYCLQDNCCAGRLLLLDSQPPCSEEGSSDKAHGIGTVCSSGQETKGFLSFLFDMSHLIP